MDAGFDIMFRGFEYQTISLSVTGSRLDNRTYPAAEKSDEAGCLWDRHVKSTAGEALQNEDVVFQQRRQQSPKQVPQRFVPPLCRNAPLLQPAY